MGRRRGHLFPFFHFQLLITSIADFKIYWHIYPCPCQSRESQRAQEQQTTSVLSVSFTACPLISARRKSNPKLCPTWLVKTKTSQILLPARLSDFFSHSANIQVSTQEEAWRNILQNVTDTILNFSTLRIISNSWSWSSIPGLRPVTLYLERFGEDHYKQTLPEWEFQNI